MKKITYIVMRYNIVSPELQRTWIAGQGTDYIDYKNKIISEERLNSRLELLEQIPLHSINDWVCDEQHPVKVVLLTTDQLPDSHKIKLEALKKKYKWLYIDYLDEGCTLKDYSRWVKTDVAMESSHYDEDVLYATFRLDDDDALSVDFLKNIEKYFSPQFIGFGISSLEGYSGVYDVEQNRFTKFYDLRSLNIGLGLGYINAYSQENGFINKNFITVYDLGAHSYIDKKVPVIVSGQKKAFIRTINHGQDTLKTYLLKGIKGKKSVAEQEVSISFPLINKPKPAKLISEIAHVYRIKNHNRFDLLLGKYTYAYRYKGIELMFYGDIKPDSSKLTIMLPGPINRSQRLSSFQRYNWSDSVDGSVIVFLDPTITVENDISIGWFQGDSENYAIPILESFIKKILIENNFDESSLTLFGSSAGGFTCLKLADEFLNSSIKVINPQTIVYNYSTKELNKLIEWIYPNNLQLTPELKERLQISLNLKDRLKPIVYYQNKHDVHHVDKHLEPLLDKLSSDFYSISEDSNELSSPFLNVVYYEDSEKGHKLPSKEDTLKLLNC